MASSYAYFVSDPVKHTRLPSYSCSVVSCIRAEQDMSLAFGFQEQQLYFFLSWTMMWIMDMSGPHLNTHTSLQRN